jgi:hypothetical protein
MPRCKQPGDLKRLSLQTLRSYISNVAYSLLCGTQKFDLGPLHNLLYASLPPVLCDKVSQEVLVAASETFTKMVDSTKSFEKEPWNKSESPIERIVLLAIHPHLRVLNITPWQLWAQKVLCRNLCNMAHLQVLELDAQFPDSLDEDLVVQGVSCMTGLQSFSMYRRCSDRIIDALAHHCTKLQSLVVTHSSGITDSSVKSVRSFCYLHHLSLLYTSIKADGFSHLFATEDDKIHPFNLLSLELRFMESYHLNLIGLVHIWPNLTHIYLANIQDDVSILSVLENLQEVKLCTCNFFTDNVDRFLIDKGSSLTCLEMDDVQDVDVLLVSVMCVRLCTLHLRNCSVIDITPRSLSQLQPTHTFKTLEHVVLLRNYNLYHVALLLKCCTNIRTLRISVADEFVYFMDDLLSRNTLRHLEEFRIGWNRSLTIRTVRLLVEHCPCLSLLGGLQCSTQISKAELEDFKQELAARNIDVSIVE